MTRFLAIDWGTTNRRIYLIDDGLVVESARDDRGVLAMADGDWPAEIAAIRARHGDLPVLIAGMAGSNRGWREAAYAPCPATLDDLTRAILWIEAGRTEAGRIGIVPGVAQDAPADVMRGEEVQLLGAVAAGLAPRDAVLCQPGTHCKWARMEAGAITGFTTAMTGELFALLRGHSILAAQLDGAVADGPRFREGVRDARDRDLLSALFGVRAAFLRGTRTDDIASYASGLVIGADVAARGAQEVHLLADPAIGALYGAAIAELGGTAHMIDSHAAFVAGITALWTRIT